MAAETRDDLSLIQQRAYDTLLDRFRNNIDDVFFMWGRQTGKTTVLNLVLEQIKKEDANHDL